MLMTLTSPALILGAPLLDESSTAVAAAAAAGGRAAQCRSGSTDTDVVTSD